MYLAFCLVIILHLFAVAKQRQRKKYRFARPVAFKWKRTNSDSDLQRLIQELEYIPDDCQESTKDQKGFSDIPVHRTARPTLKESASFDEQTVCHTLAETQVKIRGSASFYQCTLQELSQGGTDKEQEYIQGKEVGSINGTVEEDGLQRILKDDFITLEAPESQLFESSFEATSHSLQTLESDFLEETKKLNLFQKRAGDSAALLQIDADNFSLGTKKVSGNFERCTSQEERCSPFIVTTAASKDIVQTTDTKFIDKSSQGLYPLQPVRHANEFIPVLTTAHVFTDTVQTTHSGNNGNTIIYSSRSPSEVNGHVSPELNRAVQDSKSVAAISEIFDKNHSKNLQAKDGKNFEGKDGILPALSLSAYKYEDLKLTRKACKAGFICRRPTVEYSPVKVFPESPALSQSNTFTLGNGTNSTVKVTAVNVTSANGHSSKIYTKTIISERQRTNKNKKVQPHWLQVHSIRLRLICYQSL